MTPQQRQALITKHDDLCQNFQTQAQLDEIAWIEFVLFSDPNRAPHSCEDEECIVCGN